MRVYRMKVLGRVVEMYAPNRWRLADDGPRAASAPFLTLLAIWGLDGEPTPGGFPGETAYVAGVQAHGGELLEVDPPFEWDPDVVY